MVYEQLSVRLEFSTSEHSLFQRVGATRTENPVVFFSFISSNRVKQINLGLLASHF